MPSPAPRTNGFAIRTATSADVDALRLILSETWRATYAPLIGDAAVDEMTRTLLSTDALRATLATGLTLIARRSSDDEPAALCYARGTGDEVFVQRLYVRPAFQGHGLGRDALARIRDALLATRIRLDVEADNAAAIAFYRATGFTETGQGSETIAGVAFRVRHLEWRA